MEKQPKYLRSALWIVAEGEYVLLKIESSKGNWITLIKERLDSPFSHIIEPAGIQGAIKKSVKEEKEVKSLKAKSLKDAGKTIREIALIMGYKHPGSISNLLTL